MRLCVNFCGCLPSLCLSPVSENQMPGCCWVADSHTGIIPRGITDEQHYSGNKFTQRCVLSAVITTSAGRLFIPKVIRHSQHMHTHTNTTTHKQIDESQLCALALFRWSLLINFHCYALLLPLEYPPNPSQCFTCVAFAEILSHIKTFTGLICKVSAYDTCVF